MPKLITLFRDKATKTVKTAEELAKLMRIYDLQVNFKLNMIQKQIIYKLYSDNYKKP